MKKVLFIITKGNFGGAQRYVFDMATSLSQANRTGIDATGFEPIVACGQGETLPTKLAECNIPVLRLQSLGRDIKLGRDWKTFRELRRLIKKESPDIVHLNSSKAGIVGALAARTVRNPQGVRPKIIFTAHGWPFNESRPFYVQLVFKCFSWLTVKLSDDTIAVSEKTARDISTWPGVSKKIHVIYNGINQINFFEGFKARQELAPHINEGFWIGVIAELHSNKGLDFLIKAYAKVKDQLPNSAVVIIGEGEERSVLEQLIKKLDLKKRVHLLGFIPDAAEYLKAFNLFVIPSRTEALAYVALEAGAAGLPIIASHVGGLPEVITPECGKTFPRGDLDTLSKSLVNLSENEEARLSFTKNINKRISTLFSLKNMVEKTVNVYNGSYE